jgi:hypothetical protein
MRKKPGNDSTNFNTTESFPVRIFGRGCQREGLIVILETANVNGRMNCFENMVAIPVERVTRARRSRKILEIVPGEQILEIRVPFATNRIRIWTDGRHRCAERVVIGLG